MYIFTLKTWVLHDIRTRTFGEKVPSWNECICRDEVTIVTKTHKDSEVIASALRLL